MRSGVWLLLLCAASLHLSVGQASRQLHSEPHTVSRVLVDLRQRGHSQEKAPSSNDSTGIEDEVNREQEVREQAYAALQKISEQARRPPQEDRASQQRLTSQAISAAFANASSGDQKPAQEVSSSESSKKNESLPYSSYELVLARINEDVTWVTALPDYWKVTVYNKGGPVNPVRQVPGHPVDIIELPNIGREGETFMHHIWMRYDSLADYTVFSQAIPFVHSPHFVDLLTDAKSLKDVQSMSLYYISEGNPEYVTPKTVVETYRKHKWYRAERLSLRTLDSIYYNDRGSATIGRQYLDENHLPAGTNIIAHFLTSVGLPGWIPETNEIGSFGYGALVGVHKSKILQHPKQVYENLGRAICGSAVTGFVMEKTYLMLFGGPQIQD